MVKFDCLIIYIDILQYFLIFNWHSFDVIVKIGIGDLSTDSKALYIIIIMFKEILIGYCQPMKSIPMLCFGPGSHGLACDIQVDIILLQKSCVFKSLVVVYLH